MYVLYGSVFRSVLFGFRGICEVVKGVFQGWSRRIGNGQDKEIIYDRWFLYERVNFKNIYRLNEHKFIMVADLINLLNYRWNFYFDRE